MSGSLTLAGVVLALVVLGVAAHRARLNPAYWLVVPMYFVFGRSALLRIVPNAVIPLPRVSLVLGYDMVFLLMVAAWVVIKARRPKRLRPIAPVWLWLNLALLTLVAAELGAAMAQLGGMSHPLTILGTRGWFYIPIGFFLLVDCLHRLDVEEVNAAIGYVAMVTTLLMVPYILTALGIHTGLSEGVVVGSGGVAIRWYHDIFPWWTGLATGYFVSTRPSWRSVAALAVLTSGVFLTYTRSFFGIQVLAIVVGGGVVLVGRGANPRRILAGFALIALLVGGLLAFEAAYPNSFRFWSKRATEISSGKSSALTAPSAKIRIDEFNAALAHGRAIGGVWGAGLFEAAPTADTVRFASWDSDWITIVFRLGLLGVGIIGAGLIVAAVWLLALGMRRHGPHATFVSVPLVAVLWYGLWRFTSIDATYWWPVSMLPIALASRAVAEAKAVATAAAFRDTERADTLGRTAA